MDKLEFEGNPCIEVYDDGLTDSEKEADLQLVLARAVQWYPGAWQINMGGNGGAITANPGEDILHIAASSWNIPENDPANGNLGIAGWNQGAKACTGYNDQFGNLQQYCSFFAAVNGTYQGNSRCRTWEAWNPEGLHGTEAQYNSSTYTEQQCERWSDLFAFLHNQLGLDLVDMLNSLTSSHGCGVHRFGIDPWRVSGGQIWTRSAGKTCPGTARRKQLPGIISRAIVIASAVRAGRCGYLPQGRVNLTQALARTGNTPIDWFDMATSQDLDNAIARAVPAIAKAVWEYQKNSLVTQTPAAMGDLLLYTNLHTEENEIGDAVWNKYRIASLIVEDSTITAAEMLAYTNKAAETSVVQTAPKV